jgi:hypothetical protein
MAPEQDRLYATFERHDEYVQIQNTLINNDLFEEPDTELDKKEVFLVHKLAGIVRPLPEFSKWPENKPVLWSSSTIIKNNHTSSTLSWSHCFHPPSANSRVSSMPIPAPQTKFLQREGLNAYAQSCTDTSSSEATKQSVRKPCRIVYPAECHDFYSAVLPSRNRGLAYRVKFHANARGHCPTSFIMGSSLHYDALAISRFHASL